MSFTSYGAPGSLYDEGFIGDQYGVKIDKDPSEELYPSGELDPSKAKKSDGGSSTYYDRKIPQWLLDEILLRNQSNTGAYIKAEELIEIIFDNDFDFGTAFKSLVRAHCASLGGGKIGNDISYECNKVEYYSKKIKDKNTRENQ